MSKDESSEIIGQVVAADIASFTAQSLELHRAPPLGSLVQTDGPIYAVVCDARTESVEESEPYFESPGEEVLE